MASQSGNHSHFEILTELYGEKLDEARQIRISQNLSTFFSILNEWDLKTPSTIQERHHNDQYKQ